MRHVWTATCLPSTAFVVWLAGKDHEALQSPDNEAKQAKLLKKSDKPIYLWQENTL